MVSGYLIHLIMTECDVRAVLSAGKHPILPGFECCLQAS
ncbi:hypothetical protein SAMN05216419_101051 [Nitrosomonas cryotolerans]|nr:hypothetical protein SAMN05216419_101051 [Nitrosomonas cryotolerans]